MKLRKSYSDVDRLYVDESRDENRIFKVKIEELDDLLGSIYDKISVIAFDALNILLDSAEVEMPNILYRSISSDENDYAKIRISIEDQAGGGYFNYEFSFQELVKNTIKELIDEDEEKEHAAALAAQLRKIADSIDAEINKNN